MPDTVPYLIVPELGAHLSRADLVADLPDADRVRVVYPKDMPLALGSGIDAATAEILVKATQWVLALTPERLNEILLFIAGSYASKEFVKGFAGDAGKDTWKAVKSLLERVRRWSQPKETAAEPMQALRVTAKYGSTSKEVDLVLDPGWAGETIARFDQLETTILPAVAHWLQLIDRTPSSDRERYILESASVAIWPRKNTTHSWWISCSDPLETRVLLLVDTAAQAFRWDKGVWKAALIAGIMFNLLQERGLRNLGECALWELERKE